jgi:hypothetical protein
MADLIYVRATSIFYARLSLVLPRRIFPSRFGNKVLHALYLLTPTQFTFIDVITVIWRINLYVAVNCNVPHKNGRAGGSQIFQKATDSLKNSRDHETNCIVRTNPFKEPGRPDSRNLCTPGQVVHLS